MTIVSRDFKILLRELERSGDVTIYYNISADGIITAYHLLRFMNAEARESAVLKPVARMEVDSDAGHGDTIIYVGVVPKSPGMPGIRSFAILYPGQKPPPGVIVLEGVEPSESLDAALSVGTGDYHPVMAAASIVDTAWRASLTSKNYRSFMESAGLDPEEDFWIPETVASNLGSIRESCNMNAAAWYPRLLSYDTAEPAKSTFEDAMLASLRAQMDFEINSLLAQAKASISGMCNDLMAVRLDYKSFAHDRLSRLLWRDLGEPVVVYGSDRCSGNTVFSLTGNVDRGRVERFLDSAAYMWRGIANNGFTHVSGISRVEILDESLKLLCG
ncbi:MAG: hypothetical protein F7B20_05900 [Aeropyrum sp.]|nr:hypothetical protein [Aeropyrum sp.]